MLWFNNEKWIDKNIEEEYSKSVMKNRLILTISNGSQMQSNY